MTASPKFSPAIANSRDLDIARQQYQYSYDHIPPVPMVNELPLAEKFSTDWYRLLADILKVLFVNTLITNRGNQGKASVRDDVRGFMFEAVLKGALPAQLTVIGRTLQIIPQLILKGLSEDFHELDDLFLSLLREGGVSIFKDSLERIKTLADQGHPTGHVRSLEGYEQLVPITGKPAIANLFTQDEIFAHMRVAGCNPVMLEQVTYADASDHWSRRFPVTEQQYQATMGSDDSLAQASQEGRLYLTDYGILAGALNGSFPTQQKYVYAPMALFAVPRGTDSARLLRPVAIQCGQTPDDEHPMLTPQSPPYAWLIAKTIVQIADANFHQPVVHLARTHLFVGIFVIATHRQLPRQHPLNRLLRPHFDSTLAINDAAQRILIAPGGGVDRLLCATIDNARVLAVKGLQSYGFNSAMLRTQLQQRGVDNPEQLPVYPYRDDALLVWDAIRQWVSDYLHSYYADDAAVQQDVALQNWAAEVQAHAGGRMQEFGEADGKIQTLEYLIDATTLIIFTASAQHAAVNFPQKELMSYTPAMPMAGYLPASILQGEVTEQDYYRLLPPLDQAQRQYNLLQLLGSVHFNQLGDYPEGHFSDPKVCSLLVQFQHSLQDVEATIRQRNLARPLPYDYLLPSNIPQSINI
jgi:arachidonate 15-lipoxygenase